MDRIIYCVDEIAGVFNGVSGPLNDINPGQGYKKEKKLK